MPRKPPNPLPPPINAASSGRPRARAKRAEQSDNATQKARQRREKIEFNKAQDAKEAAESQLVEDTDTFMFAPAGDYVEPTLGGTTESDRQQYEREKANFLLRKAAMRGGEDADLRAEWATGDMTLEQLEARVEKLALKKSGLLASSADKGQERAGSASGDEPDHPGITFSQRVAAKTAPTKVDRFSGLPPSSSTGQPSANRSNAGSSQKKRTNPYVEDPFADNSQVPQVPHKPALNAVRPTTPALTRTDNDTLLGGRRLYYPQSLPPDEPIHVPATAATIPDTPPRKKSRHVTATVAKPTTIKPSVTKPTAKSAGPRLPSGNLKISSSAPVQANPGSKTRHSDIVPRTQSASPVPQRAPVPRASNPKLPQVATPPPAAASPVPQRAPVPRVSNTKLPQVAAAPPAAASPIPQRAPVPRASNPKPAQVALASPALKSNAGSAPSKIAPPSRREPGRVAPATAAGQQAMPLQGSRSADRSARLSASSRSARQDIGVGQGAVIAKASSHSRAGHTSINNAQLSVTANGHPAQPVDQGARRTGSDALGSVRQVPQPAVNRDGAGSQPSRPRAQAGNRSDPLPCEPNPQQPNRQQPNRRVPNHREPAHEQGREPRNDDVNDDDPLDDVEGEEDLERIPEEGDLPDPTNTDGSPTDPGEARLFNYKAVLRSFAPQCQPTVRTFRNRYKVKKIANGSYEWESNQAGPRYPSDDVMGARVWAWATKKHHNHYPYLLEHVKHGDASVGSYRTCLRNSIEQTVVRLLGFSNDDPEKNRRLAKELLPHKFHERETERGIEPFGNGFIEEACLDAVFNGPSSLGIKYPMYFSPIRWRFLALMATLSNNTIRGWAEGVYKRLPLDSDKHLPLFRKYLLKIEETYAKQPVRLDNLCLSIPDVGRARYAQSLPPSSSPEPEARWAPDVVERYEPRFKARAAEQEDEDVEMEDAEEPNPAAPPHAGPGGRRQTSPSQPPSSPNHAPRAPSRTPQPASSGKGKGKAVAPSSDADADADADADEDFPDHRDIPTVNLHATRSCLAGPSQPSRHDAPTVAAQDSDDEEPPSPRLIRMAWNGPAPQPKLVCNSNGNASANGEAPMYDDGDDDDKTQWDGGEEGNPGSPMAPADPEEAEYEDEAEPADLD